MLIRVLRIFIIEGCLTMSIGLVCCFSTVGRPEKARFLTEDDRETIASTIADQRLTFCRHGCRMEDVLPQPLNYVWSALYVFTCTTAYSVAIFAPSFVQAFNPTFSVPQVQGQVVPIFVVSAFVTLAAAYSADRFDHRSAFALAGYCFSIIGYAILRLPNIISPSVTIFALYCVSIGVYISLPDDMDHDSGEPADALSESHRLWLRGWYRQRSELHLCLDLPDKRGTKVQGGHDGWADFDVCLRGTAGLHLDIYRMAQHELGDCIYSVDIAGVWSLARRLQPLRLAAGP